MCPARQETGETTVSGKIAISVVIPMHDCSTTINDTLKSILSSVRKPDEIICVDDASQDNTLEVVRAFSKSCEVAIGIVALERTKGPAHARNRGAQKASSAYLLFLDSDVTLQPDTLTVLATRLQSSQGRGAAVALYHERNLAGGILSDFTTFYSAYNYSFRRSPSRSHFSSQCALVCREDFFAVGGFDESFRAATVEDIELGWRMRDASLPIVAESAARVFHNSRYDFRGFTRNYWYKSFDFASLLLHKPRASRGNQGYGGRHNMISMALVVLLLLCIIASVLCPLFRWPAVLIGCATVVHWRAFVKSTARHWGLGRVIVNVVLKAFVLLICFGAGIGSVATSVCRGVSPRNP